jgi:RNA polymerase sigma-70 factor, ECF subfamily
VAADGGDVTLAAADLELLEAARRGDEDAYARLVGPHRAQLHAHCYRMLASAPDAEDALQEALLGAWRGLPRFEGRSSLRSWLYTIATNACLKAIERRPKRVLPVDYGPGRRSTRRPGRAAGRIGLGQPLPRPRGGVHGSLVGAGRALPAA